MLILRKLQQTFMEDISLPQFPNSQELYEKAYLKSVSEVKVIFPFLIVLPLVLVLVTFILFNQNIYTTSYLLFYSLFVISTAIIFYFLLLMYRKGLQSPHVLYGVLTDSNFNKRTNIIELSINAKYVFKLNKDEKPVKITLKEDSILNRKLEENNPVKESLHQKKETPCFWLSTGTGKIVDFF
ncbi:MAG: hypothetical protein EA412_14050 [Chitinophagaceae bacterium]|nr:MAG: hypothetical protein EA412_14050 [Chitinophagaceae bacterium]